jgi:hypothetical protein
MVGSGPAGVAPLLFIHNPKAGGTTVARHLRGLYPESEIAPIAANDPAWAGTETWVGQGPFRFAAGHFGYDAVRHFAPGAAIITNFREPVARIVSLFDFWRHNFDDTVLVQHPASGPALVRHMSFRDFITTSHPVLSLYVADFHARQLLGSGWRRRSVNWLDLLRLRRRIDRLAWFFVCEFPELSAAWFAQALPWAPAYDAAQRLNATDYAARPPTRPTAEEVRIVLSRNQADSSIYAHAVGLLLRRLGRDAPAIRAAA